MHGHDTSHKDLFSQPAVFIKKLARHSAASWWNDLPLVKLVALFSIFFLLKCVRVCVYK